MGYGRRSHLTLTTSTASVRAHGHALLVSCSTRFVLHKIRTRSELKGQHVLNICAPFRDGFFKDGLSYGFPRIPRNKTLKPGRRIHASFLNPARASPAARRGGRDEAGTMPSRVKEAWGEGPSRPPQAEQAIADEEAEDDDNVTKDEWFEQVSTLKQKQVNKQQKRGAFPPNDSPSRVLRS